MPIFLGFTWRHNFTGGQLQIDAQSSKGYTFSLYVLTLCLAANMCNFVRFFHSSTAWSSIHFGLTPTQISCKIPWWNPRILWCVPSSWNLSYYFCLLFYFLSFCILRCETYSLFFVYICFLHSILYKINNRIKSTLQCICLLSLLYGGRADKICGKADNILPNRKTSMPNKECVGHN